ncbi:MAG: hypothetical protein PUG48_05870 [Clostridia bacterium]|nr:hypothetical protein [Clostridia bacterium]
MYSSSVDRVGTKQELRINPYNPNDFIEPKRLKTLRALLLMMGGIFAGMGLFVMILFVLII